MPKTKFAPAVISEFFLAKVVPKRSILDKFELLGFIDGSRRWRSHDGQRLYTWDALHGEVEVFNSRGKHLGALGAATRKLIKPAVAGRRIDV